MQSKAQHRKAELQITGWVVEVQEIEGDAV